jgi:hypothetical protein
MKEDGVPLTRENFLERHNRDRNYQPVAEEEVDFPDQFRRIIGPLCPED